MTDHEHVHAPLTAMGRSCIAHKHTTLVPIEVHHVFPLGDGGPDVKENKVPLCSNAHSSVHYLIDMYRKIKSTNIELVPWATRRQFGPVVRELAFRGWVQIAAAKGIK